MEKFNDGTQIKFISFDVESGTDQIVAMADFGDIYQVKNPTSMTRLVKTGVSSRIYFTPVGNILLAGNDKIFRCYDLAGKLLAQSAKQEDFIRAVAFLPDFDRMAVSTYAGIRLYSLESMKETDFLSGYPGWTFGVASSADQGFLAAAGSDYSLMIWNRSGRAVFKKLTGYTTFIKQIRFYHHQSEKSQDIAKTDSVFKEFLLGLSDREIIRWSFPSGEKLDQRKLHFGRIADCDLDRNSKKIAIATDQCVMIMRLPDMQTINTIPQPASQVRFSTDGNRLYFISQGELYAWKIQSPDQIFKNYQKSSGAIVRMNPQVRTIYLVFTGHGFSEGGQTIAKTLQKNQIKASFFFTGDFYRNPENKDLIQHLIQGGHYLGGHSDQHILYCSLDHPDSMLVAPQEFFDDIIHNYQAMNTFGIQSNHAPYYLPPFEKCNDQIAAWADELGLRMVNYTPGTLSNQDYSIPSMGRDYCPSQKIYDSIMNYEHQDFNGLNGFILLTHIGSHPERTDKFYAKLDSLIIQLNHKGYTFDRFYPAY